MNLKPLILIVAFLIPSKLLSNSLDQDYCVGYLEEVYWSLDPIEEIEIRESIIKFFDDNFEGAKNLEYDLYYDSKSKQFLTNLDGVDISKYKKVNYPNFEILLLDAYINLFRGDGANHCPAFWDNCSEESLSAFFQASEDFSQSWNGEENVIKFLTNHFINHHCTMYLDSSVDQKTFVTDLNILINELTK